MTDRKKALDLFVTLEAMTVTTKGQPDAEDPSDREDVIEPMFDVRLDAATHNPDFEAKRELRLRVKWSSAEGLDWLETKGNDKLREVIDLASGAGAEVRIENSALEIV